MRFSFSDFKIAEEGIFGFGKSKKPTVDYNTWSDEQLAKRLVTSLRKSGIKVHDETDDNTKIAVELCCAFSKKYQKYNINGALVLVTYDKNILFSVWGSGKYIGQHQCISTQKDQLIKSFIKEDKHK